MSIMNFKFFYYVVKINEVLIVSRNENKKIIGEIQYSLVSLFTNLNKQNFMDKLILFGVIKV